MTAYACPVARPKLHDDALRVRLLDTAASLLTFEGPDALFGGKPGILQGLFIEAFTRFAAELDTVIPSYAHAKATFTPLLDTVRRAVAAGLLRETNPYLIATTLWATVHGVVSLELGRAVPERAGDPAGLFEAAIRATLDGWRLRP
ncbi:MAG: WHG domain-containing protein [Pseudonocardiales bacterium]|nr:WHG domain-containing protein [Pseudonocardiales bacterium]